MGNGDVLSVQRLGVFQQMLDGQIEKSRRGSTPPVSGCAVFGRETPLSKSQPSISPHARRTVDGGEDRRRR
ncbi:hypothetical protein L1049_014427 [Liquidambar formosana]|uniref:Uncharacterized protein n=1 Tax=Liquidambar formosana TaxID=63359 RepID=A0AAP0RX28_LIQFO